MSHRHCPRFVPPRARGAGPAGLNSAALRRVAALPITIQLAWLSGRAGREVLRLGLGPGGGAGTHPWPWDLRAGHLPWRHRRFVGRRRQAARAPACRPASAPPPTTPPSIPLWRHIKGSPVPAGSPRPGWSLRGGGGDGAGPELPAPAWAGRHTEECSLLRPPAQRVPRVHPAWLRAEPGPRGAARSTGSRGPPTSMPAGPRLPSVYQRVLGRIWHVQAWPTVHTQGPTWGAHLHLGGPAPPPNPRPQWPQAWDHRLGAKGAAGWLHPQPLHTHSPPHGARQTPRGGPHAQTRTSPPPAPQHLGQECRGRLGRPVQTPLRWIKRKMLS